MSVRRPIWLLVMVVVIACSSVLDSGSATLGGSLPGSPEKGVGQVASPPARASTPEATVLSPIQPPDDTIGHVPGRVSTVGRVGLPAYIPLASKHIYDQALLLSVSEEKTLEGDARLLGAYGLPVFVFVRRSTDTVSESRIFADNLRTQRAVESAPGADDGLVMLLTLGLQSRFGASLVFSIGAHALPVQGLSKAALDQTYREDIAPNLRQAKIYDALNISLRRMSYKAWFVPGDAPPVSDLQRTTASLLSFASPLLLILFAGLTVVGRIAPDVLFRRVRITRRSWNRAEIALGVGIIIVLIPVAVYARSSLGISCALTSLLILTVMSLVKPGGGRGRMSGTARTIAVQPRRGFRRSLPDVKSSSKVQAGSIAARRRQS